MPRQPYMPKTAEGIDLMLVNFDTNMVTNSGALATKYDVAAEELPAWPRAASPGVG